MCKNTQNMSKREQKRIEREFLIFARRNFEKPSRCRNLGQLQYYISELSRMIEQLKDRQGYAPAAAYEMLTEYNRAQNSLLYVEFKKHYSSSFA